MVRFHKLFHHQRKARLFLIAAYIWIPEFNGSCKVPGETAECSK